MHWEDVYTNKDLNKVSWVQDKPNTSLELIAQINLEKSAKIIDIAGGNSNLVDYLLAEGYKDVSVLDISNEALEVSKKRLGNQAKNVEWIVTDILQFESEKKYDLWHDRAGFHFLTQEKDIKTYKNILEKTKPRFLIIGTFSEKGPNKCSGLPIQQYSTQELAECFSDSYQLLESKNVNHTTPTGNVQNFSFCSFKRRA